MSSPLISICIPVYNGARFIEAAIDSVVRQSFERWSLLVCDNNSTDETRTIVERYSGDRRISLLPSSTNLGMAGNYTRCVNSVRTPYFMILCHDDLLFSPDALAKAWAVMEKNPDVAAVHSNLVYINSRGRIVAHRCFDDSGPIDSLALARRSIVNGRNLFGIPLLMRTAVCAGRSFDPNLPYIIDLDFSVATCRSKNIYRIPEFLAAYRCHGSNATNFLRDGIYGQMIALAQKHGVALSGPDRMRARCNAWQASLLRRGFLFYAEVLRK